MTEHPENLKKVKFSSLVDGLDYAAQTDKGWRFYDENGDLTSKSSYAQARDYALVLAKKMSTLGWERYARIGLIANQEPAFLIAFFACQYAGFLPCPLPVVNYIGGKADYVERLCVLSEKAKLTALIGPENLQKVMQDVSEQCRLKNMAIFNYEELNALHITGDIAPLGSDEPAYIQFSSGSTSEPKGVWITQHAITSNIAMTLKYGLEARSTDRTVSWLPFYHDMGLAGHVLASICGISTVDYISPFTLVRKPETWIKLISQKRAQTSFAPSFAWGLASKIPHPEHYDLSAFRIAGVGGDMIRIEELEAFSSAFKNSGFREECFLPCYGMAEAVLGVSFQKPGKKPVTHSLTPEGRRIVSVGRALPGIDLIIVDENGKEVPEQITGYIWVRAPDLMTQYFEDEAATAITLRRDNFRDTGDMGYFVEGELIITGRSKEMILFRGRNIWPQDIERIIERIHRGHSVMAFSIDEGLEEKIIALVPFPEEGAEGDADLKSTLVSAVFKGLGIPITIVLVAPDAIPYTSSGKPSRADARKFYLEMFATK